MQANHRINLQPCYVLHQRPYRDTSALVDMFAKDYGRVTLVAKGVRTKKSRWAGQLQSFRPLLGSWMGRGELATLTALEADGPAALISPKWFASGFYLNELLMRLLIRHDPHPELYTVYQTTLSNLTILSQEKSEQIDFLHQCTLRIFEKCLLEELGYGLTLDHEVETGQAVVAQNQYHYQLERGPVSSDGEIVEGIPISGAGLLALANAEFQDETQLRETKRLMRAVLARYLGDKPLYSRELLKPAARAKSITQGFDKGQ